MSELPPGFVLDDGPVAVPTAPRQAVAPSLPDGFVLDEGPAPPSGASGKGGDHEPSFGSRVWNWMTTPNPDGPSLVKMGKEVANAVGGGLTLTREALDGTLDPTSDDAIRRAAHFAYFNPANPVTVGSTMARAGATVAKDGTSAAADALGIGLTAGQRAGDPALLSTENAMFGGAMGDGAQRIAQEAVARQKDQVAAAKGAIGETAGRGQAQIERPAEAADAVTQAVRQTAADAKAGYQERYADAFAQDGSLDTRFFSGHATPGETLPAVPGSVQADFAAPLSKRITDSLVRRDEPVIIDPTLTPAAHRALAEMDGVSNLRLGSIGQPGAADDVLGVNLRGVDQARRKLAAYGRAAASNPADQRAVQSIVREFDGQVQEAMERGLFSGSDAALEKLKDARAAYASYQKAFKPQGAGDDVGRAMQAMVERDVTPEEAANFLYGGTKVGAAGRSVRVADRLKAVLGEDSPEWAAVRQGAWQRALGPMEAGPAVAAKRILDFVEGDGTSLSTRLFSAEERGEMTKLANVLRAISARPGTVNPSNSGNRLAGLARQSMSALGAMLGAKLEGATGAGVGYVAGKGLEKLSGARNAAQARQLFGGEAPVGIGGRLRQAGVGVQRAAVPQLLPSVGRILLPQADARQ